MKRPKGLLLGVLVSAAVAAAAAQASASEACFYTNGACGQGYVGVAPADNGYWTGAYYTYGFRTYQNANDAQVWKGGWVKRGTSVLGGWYGSKNSLFHTHTFSGTNSQQHKCGQWGTANPPNGTGPSVRLTCSILY